MPEEPPLERGLVHVSDGTSIQLGRPGQAEVFGDRALGDVQTERDGLVK